MALPFLLLRCARMLQTCLACFAPVPDAVCVNISTRAKFCHASNPQKTPLRSHQNQTVVRRTALFSQHSIRFSFQDSHRMWVGKIIAKLFPSREHCLEGPFFLVSHETGCVLLAVLRAKGWGRDLHVRFTLFNYLNSTWVIHLASKMAVHFVVSVKPNCSFRFWEICVVGISMKSQFCLEI